MKRFFISRLSSLGDVVCSLPAAHALKAGFPESEVTWAVSPRFATIVERCGAVDRVIRVEGLGRLDPAPEDSFTATLDLQGLLKSAVPVMRVRAETKVGYHWQREGSALFSRRVLPDPTSLHVVDQYVDVARAVGGLADRAEFGLRPRSEDLEAVRAKLPPDLQPFVVVNPGAAWASKRWPPAHVAALASGLARSGLTPVLIGGGSDSERALETEISAMIPEPHIPFAGQTNLAELIALISLARAHVGGDTGSSHIAAALGIPAIGLYSVTRPERSCPYGQIGRCHYAPEGLDRILPADVLKTVMEAA